MKKLFFFFLLLTNVQAQPFTYVAPLKPISQNGYHRLVLPPAVAGHLNNRLSDIRLYDSKQQEIPYLLTRQAAAQQSTFRPYEIVSRQMTPRGATTLVLRNASKSQINSLGLIIKNTNVSKTAHLSGSNDAKIWYGIEDNIVLEPVRNNQATSEIKLLDFPLSDYEYYQLTVNDSLTAPLNILQVGYYARSNQQPAYTVLPGLSFTQRDSLKQSLIHIRFPEAVRLDKLVFSIQSPAQYHRRVVFSQLKTRKNKRGRWLQYYEPLREIYLRSDGDQTVILPGLKVADLYLSIDNQDNPPLVIKTIQAYQAEISLVAELDKDKSYQLRFGNGAAVAPAYDLLYFKDKIPAILPIAEVGTVSLTKTGEIGTAMSVFQNPWILWPALGLVLGLLGFMSYRMLGEMGKG